MACTAHGVMGLQAAVQGGLGVSMLGKSFVGRDLSEAPATLKLPSLPDTEVAVFGEEGARVELAGCLAGFLTDALARVASGAARPPFGRRPFKAFG